MASENKMTRAELLKQMEKVDILITKIESTKKQAQEYGLNAIMISNEFADIIVELLKEQKPKVGHWIDYPECLRYDGAYSDDHHVCSECKAVFSHMDSCMEDWKCCPNCGAIMENT